MKGIIEGKWCGKCHDGELAFAPKECKRCHTYVKEDARSLRLMPKKSRKKAIDYAKYRKEHASKYSGTNRDGRGFVTRKMMKNETVDKDAFKGLERDRFGMVNWVKAVNRGKIAPLSAIGKEKIEDVIDKSVRNIPVKSNAVADVRFSHEVHTYWLNCSSCHDELWTRDGMYVEMKMVDFVKGKGCGKCHGNVSFSLGDCNRCHTIPKKKLESEKVITEDDGLIKVGDGMME